MRYKIIYADPPWSSRKAQWGAEKHYQTMRTQDICALPISGIAADNSILFLWTIGCHLDSALKVINAWGFTYKTVGFNWVKVYRNGNPVSGLGHWVKQGSELCLLATRGNPKRVNKSVMQVIVAPITRHSEKPAVVRDRIVQLMGDLPRIELFARERADGWDAWGNEVESSIDL